MPDRTLLVPVAASVATATVVEDTIGYTPMRFKAGTRLKLTGNGFCPGTRVEVGNTLAIASTTVAPDSRSLLFHMPRLATTGPVTVVPPGANARPYVTSNMVTTRTFRSYNAYQFENFDWGSLSWGELVDAYGKGDMFIRANPCWPLYYCPVPTGIPNPLAYLSFLTLKTMAPESNGHCFGMVRTLPYFLFGLRHPGQFTPGADHPYALGSSSGPGSKLRHFIDGQHTVQWSVEALHAFLNRSTNVADQVQRIKSSLRSDFPGVALFYGGANKTVGHVVTAYDLKETSNGFDIYVYNNNTPFRPAVEIGPSKVDAHRDRETGDQGVIRVRGNKWTFVNGSSSWSGTGGTMWAMPSNTAPRDPTLVTLPSTLLTFTLGQFGSPSGAARVGVVPAGVEWLPALDKRASPMTVGTLLANGERSLSHIIRGSKRGTYSELLTGNGFSAAVMKVRTDAGVVDRITANPKMRSIQFSGTKSRPVELTIAVANGRSETRTAIIHTTTRPGDSERVRLARNGALIYEHTGKETAFSVELSSSAPSAGTPRVTTGPLRISAGDRVTISPRDWRSLSKLRLEVRHAGRARIVRTITSRRVIPDVGVHVSRPKFQQSVGGREVLLTTTFSRVPTNATGAVLLQLKHAGRVVKSRAVPLYRIRAGLRVDHWQLPKHLGAGYRLDAHITVIAGQRRPATLTITRSAVVPGPKGSAHHVVRRGDTLWDLARHRLPSGATDTEITREWHRWYNVNHRVVGDDPDLIFPGQILRVPSMP